jgi:hypothetical protein
VAKASAWPTNCSSKRGFVAFWKTIEKQGHNPITNESVIAHRRVLHTEWNLPLGESYSTFISSFCE